ncbi:receptor-like serine/threonine-protein kinase SD1-8 isoform X4 [Nicotiana sylvestris]|uniref:Receptor-like serine/threonine-protein kinase n=1 Tax=Nicotiana sylvestris TaxID=4096 RepID=A0A1U7XPM9_NICSY|nr:PREDICTED: G-type lectin S-receptor-like serine/threonine-protein kinase At4g03230 isoform X4 [Nicotiana sylvestris]
MHFFVLLFVILLCIHQSLGIDMISVNHSIFGNQTIISSGENFELGFFKPGTSKKYYLGIWYRNVIPQTVVWVANREKPLSATDMMSAELKVLDGNLVLITESKSLFWSTNISSTSSNSLVATISDDGNLIFSDGLNSTPPLWQSFDHPTDTWLPNAKTKYDKRSNTTKKIISWKNSEDPSPGFFSVEMDQSNRQFLLKWNRTEMYSATGPWNGRIFSLMPEMSLNSQRYNFSYVDNENESYFMYSVSNSHKIRLTLDVSGQIRHLIWVETLMEWQLFTTQPRQPCEVYASCGAFSICNKESASFCNCLTGFTPRSDAEWDLNDHSGGCVRRLSLQCVAGKTKGGFLRNSKVTLPEHSQTVTASSAEECHSICLNDCSCNAYAYDTSVCSIWNDELLNLRKLSPEDGGGSVIYTRLNALDQALGEVLAVVALCSFSYIYYRRKMAKRKGTCVVDVFSGLIVLPLATGKISPSVFLFCLNQIKRDISNSCFLILANQQSTEGNPVPHWTEREAQNLIYENDKQDIAVPFFRLEKILAATDNFSDAQKLGQGGFGPVYKGIFSGGQEIAVKRLSSQSRQGIGEFRNEVILISKLQHRNLVRLLGYCITGYEQILLYEYMPNKSLDTFIFEDQTLSKSLKWKKRFDIISGISRGLLYLHEDSRLRIIHRDLKTSNILLDQEMNPKISDFGLARIVEEKTTEANTKKVVGTYGYMSPEYALEGLFSIKSDVFSLGVVILEIITGRRNTGFYQSKEASNLLGYAWNFWKEERALHLLDHSLLESCNPKEAMKCINVGLLCVQEDPGDRPTMSNVVMMLRSESMPIPKPNQPAFVSRKYVSNVSPALSAKPHSSSKVELTITMEEGR